MEDGPAHWTKVGKRNQITIPASMLRELGVAPGQAVEVRCIDRKLQITSARQAIAHAHGLLRRLGAPALSDEELQDAIREARVARAKRAEEKDARSRDVLD